MSTLPEPPAEPVAAKSTSVAAPKKASPKPKVSAPTARPAAKPLAKAFAPAESAQKPAKVTEKSTQPERPPKALKAAAAPAAGQPAKQPKAAKLKKPKLVRERFTATEDDVAVWRAIKQRSGTLGLPVKKGTVLRAGIRALTALSDSALVSLLKQIPGIK